MTLAGLLPPLCDNGGMLVDGGYSTSVAYADENVVADYRSLVDNLPVSIIDLSQLSVLEISIGLDDVLSRGQCSNCRRRCRGM